MTKCVLLCGYTCAGKTLGGELLSKHQGFIHIEASAIMREFWAAEGGSGSLDSFAVELLRSTPDRVPIEALRRAAGAPVVITGLRSPREIMAISQRSMEVRRLFLEAPPALRLVRSVARNRPSHPTTELELAAIDAIHTNMGIHEVRSDPLTETVMNDDTIGKLHERLRAFVNR